MAIDLETYYILVEDTGLKPLCRKLFELDKYSALRFMLIMEKIHSDDSIVKNYSGTNKLDELEYSKDMIAGVFDGILTHKLKISPGKEQEFHNILIQIESQKCNYVLHSPYFDTVNKIDYLNTILKAVKQRQLHIPTFVELSVALEDFLNSSITQLKLNIENENQGTDPENLQGSVQDISKNSKSRNSIKNELSLESFFNNKKIVKPLIDFLKKEHIISENGKWIGKSRRKTDILGFIDALEYKSIVSFDFLNSIAIVFCKKFNVKMHTRAIYIKTYIRNDSKEDYIDFLEDFLLDFNQKSQKKMAE